LLDEALKAAKAAGDSRLEALVLLERAFFLLQMGGNSEESLALAEQAIPLFEEHRDDESLARVWHLVGWAELHRGQSRRAEDAWERGLKHARAAGDPHEEAEILAFLTVGLEAGPTPVPEVLERLDAILAAARGDQKVAAAVSIVSGSLAAMEGRFDQARDLIAGARATLEERGQRMAAAAAPSLFLGQVELLAGDPAAAEAALRAGYDALERMGEKAYLSTVAAYLAEALYAQRRYAEAEDLTVASDSAAAPDDVESQVRWRCVRAKVLARRGEQDEAERIAREALALADETDYLQTRADARIGLAEVLSLAAQPGEAARALAEASELYEGKGIVILATRTRALLEGSRPSFP